MPEDQHRLRFDRIECLCEVEGPSCVLRPLNGLHVLPEVKGWISRIDEKEATVKVATSM